MINHLQKSGVRTFLFRLFIMVSLAVLSVAAITLVRYQQFQDTRLDVPADGLIYTLPAGASLNRLASDLTVRGIIRHPRFFILLGRQLEAATRLQAGEYSLIEDMTPRAMLEEMVAGKVIQHELPLIEGHSFREMMQRVHAQPVLEHTLIDKSDAEIMAAIGHPEQQPEGRFMPDTYHITRGTTDVEFLQRAYQAMASQLQAEWEGREEGLPFKSADEALILASIVEKETGAPDERPAIAGVFVRRLQKSMRLQTDPTVIYGMGASYDGNIRKRDLLKDTPYNTYTRDGLPPTPIAMPGVDAIHAVMHPAKGKSLYFVAMGEGRHYFSSTLKQHNLAVDKFQKNKKGITLPPSGQ
ncbi:MAG: endolytic transglycosylase MltG [Pseudomonadota bacterium]